MRDCFYRWWFVVEVLKDHCRRRGLVYLLIGAAGTWFHVNYRFGVNISESLPHRFFLVVRGESPTRVGDYVAFEWRRHQFYRPSSVFVKRVGGIEGQTVTVLERRVFVDGRDMGVAKTQSKHGTPLPVIHGGVIPPGQIYATTPHPDSLDSRYETTGLVDASRVIGKAYALF